MNSAQELERLVVRIVGDGSHYTRTLNKVVKDTTRAVDDINKATGKAVRVGPKSITAPVVRAVKAPGTPTRVPGAAVMGGTSFAALNADVKQAKLPKAVKATGAGDVGPKVTIPKEFGAIVKETAAVKAHTKAVKDATAATAPATKAQAAHTAAVKAVKAPLDTARDATGRFVGKLKEANTAHGAGVDAARRHGGALGFFGNMVAGAGRHIQNTAGRLKATGQAMGIMGAIMAVSVTLPVLGAATALVKLASDAETTKNQFAVMLGADQGAQMLANLRKMGAETPFEFPELAGSAKTLVGFGTAQEKVLPTLKMLGDVSAGTGKDIRELSVIFGQIQGMGRLQGQDFLQLVNAGFPVQEIAKTIGTDMEGLKAAMEDGAVSSDVVAETFRRLTAEGGQFHNMMEVLSKTAAGKFSTLMDGVKEVAVAMGEHLLPTIKNVLDYLIAGATWFKNLGAATHKTVMFVVALVGGVAPLLIALGTFFTITGFLGVGLTAMFVAGAKVVAVLALIAGGAYVLVRGIQMLVDGIYGQGSFVGALYAAGTAAWSFTQKVLGFILNIKQNFQILGEWVKLQFTNLFAGVAVVWGAEMEGMTAGLETWRGYLATTFDNAIMTVRAWAGNVIGFIANIGENLRLLLGWFGRNWQNILKDMGMLWWTHLKNSASNLLVAIETMMRLFNLFAGFMTTTWKNIFTLDFAKWVGTGIVNTGKMWLDYYKNVWKGLKSIFTGGNATELSDQVGALAAQLSNDFSDGMNTDNLVKSGMDIIGQQMGKMKSPLDGFQSSMEALPELNLNTDNLPKIITDVVAPVTELEKDTKKAAPEVKTMALNKKKEDKKEEEKKDEEVKTGEFKQMSLRQFSVNPVGTNNGPKKQEVTDVGVQNKLDQVVGAIKGQNQPATMGR